MRNLPFREWLIHLVVTGFIASIIITSVFTARSARINLEKSNLAKKISVDLSGALRNKGRKYFMPGTDLATILKIARPTKDADLSKVDIKKKIQEPCIIHIPELTAWSIHIRGAVIEKKTIEVPLKTRLSDLKKILSFSEDADLTSLKSRRYLKHEETVTVRRK